MTNNQEKEIKEKIHTTLQKVYADGWQRGAQAIVHLIFKEASKCTTLEELMTILKPLFNTGNDNKDTSLDKTSDE